MTSTLFGWNVLDEVEYGGIGNVLRVRDPEENRELAFHRLPPGLVQDAPRFERLKEECQRAAELHHPHLAQNLGLREEGGAHYVGLAFHRGVRLLELIARKPLPPPRAVELAIQLAGAVARIHDRGWTHGEIRPADVIVDDRGQAVMIGFGLAALRDRVKVTESLAPLREHSPPELARWAAFQSPEQAQAQPLDYRSDIFSLGAVFYAMLTGRPPFQRESGSDSLSALLRAPTPQLAEALGAEVREIDALQQIVDRCLVRDPAKRYLLLLPSRAFRRESWEESQDDRSLDEDLRAVRRALSRPEAPLPQQRSGCLGRAAALLAAALAALGCALG